MSGKSRRGPKSKPISKLSAEQTLGGSTGVDATNPGPFSVVGAPGTAIYGGQVVSKEVESRLQGRQKYITYSNMLANTSIVGAGVRHFVDLVAKAEWSVDPADDSAKAEEMAELVDEIIRDMTTPWYRIIKRMALFAMYGFSIAEWTAKRREDGIIGLLDIEPRSQKTIDKWELDLSGTVTGFIQTDPQTGKEIYLPRGKCLYIVDDALDDSPEGLGRFRHLVKIADRLEKYELLEHWGFETDLRGVPVARGPFTDLEVMVQNGTLSRVQATALKAPMLDFIENHNRSPEMGMLLDSRTYQTTDERSAPSNVRQWDVELLKGDPQSVEEIAAAIERLNREMARILGVEQLLLGESSGGSHALSRDKTQAFGLMVDSALVAIKEVVERDLLDTLWALNGWDEDLKPKFKIEKIQYRDVEQVAATLETLARAGATMDINDPAINEIRTQLGLSDAPEQDEIDMDLALNGMNPMLPDGSDEDESTEPEDEGETEKMISRILRKMFTR
tara:strand:+ start:9777 stop:11288 length:1512 start_codon:yes stop_codon:yes gene_type:complete